tara:strand:+ start:2636 stop:2737 length:102 start_codon:yes stop_codon:yes gene_type:complete
LEYDPRIGKYDPRIGNMTQVSPSFPQVLNDRIY